MSSSNVDLYSLFYHNVAARKFECKCSQFSSLFHKKFKAQLSAYVILPEEKSQGTKFTYENDSEKELEKSAVTVEYIT